MHCVSLRCQEPEQERERELNPELEQERERERELVLNAKLERVLRSGTGARAPRRNGERWKLVHGASLTNAPTLTQVPSHTIHPPRLCSQAVVLSTHAQRRE